MISLKWVFEGSESVNGLLQDVSKQLDSFWNLLSDLAQCNPNGTTDLTMQVERYRKDLPPGEDYFATQAYFDKVNAKLGVLNF